MKVAWLRSFIYRGSSWRPELLPCKSIEIQSTQLIDHAPDIHESPSKDVQLVANGRGREAYQARRYIASCAADA